MAPSQTTPGVVIDTVLDSYVVERDSSSSLHLQVLVRVVLKGHEVGGIAE